MIGGNFITLYEMVMRHFLSICGANSFLLNADAVGVVQEMETDVFLGNGAKEFYRDIHQSEAKRSTPHHLGILYSSLNGNAVKISLLPLCASWIKNSGSNSWPARVSETFYFYRGTIFLLLLAQKRRGHFFLCGSRLRLETMSFCCRVSFLRLYVRWPPYARDFDSLLHRPCAQPHALLPA